MHNFQQPLRRLSESLVYIIFLLFTTASIAARPIAEIADIYGDRQNQLIGYGLVVGLDGSGDKSQVKFTQQSVVNMIKQFGVQLDDTTNPKLKNVAAVSVTAMVEPHMGAGQTLTVTVSSIGDAKSLRGGTLLLTPLRGIDGEVYAIAQGSLVVGGFNATGANGTSVTRNTPTVGRIPNGATLERNISAAEDIDPTIKLQLKQPSYETALNISKAINQMFGGLVAKALNKGQVEVSAPEDSEDRVMFVSMIQKLEVVEGLKIPKVVFNSRTGTVVISQNVTVSQAAVSQGGITVTILESESVSQPGGAFNSVGETAIVQNSEINISEVNGTTMIWPRGTNLQEIVDAINNVGATPEALMQILQALDEVGALNGDLVVI
ncbi:flagellar basal body P-ring protein FlgI [Photobacterium sp. BZF1]|uniref:flagellar basal body P-ring protein FlgI n=1 Tax=Photobacterium sp. BZF1 TaxID=1904457 RepID=UPI0016538EBE|nr:flagellar basal body P-ring protein FlgI [Photobacterium sp. BZF1]MBC7001603.1 flagellar basal body P-ring protein FlgI [Photobacterium sp. BZF1]